jgi:nucleoside-diphosphate-sugar epimerase
VSNRTVSPECMRNNGWVNRQAFRNKTRSFAMRILVTGGTGRVGSEVIKALVKRNASVRALVRKQEASTTMPEGIEVSLGDLLDPVAVRKALDGVDKL